MNVTTRRARAAAIAATLALALGACGDDDAATEEPSDDATATATDEPTASEEPEGEVIQVTATDYAYAGLPDTIAAGTTVELQNDSEVEVHEILAFRVADGEDRSVADLMALDEAELMTLLELRGVALAPPGASSTALPAPPATIEQPGRYIFACMIPTDAPPDEVMAAVQAFIEAGAPEGGAPEYPETGPPHVVQGMFAEVTVE